MDRRNFARVVVAGLVAARSSADAQPAAKAPRVGFLTYTTPPQTLLLLREFTEGLRDLGYVEGRNIVLEVQYGDGTQNHLASLAAEMVRSGVDIIVTGSNPIALAAKRATSTIPDGTYK